MNTSDIRTTEPAPATLSSPQEEVNLRRFLPVQQADGRVELQALDIGQSLASSTGLRVVEEVTGDRRLFSIRIVESLSNLGLERGPVIRPSRDLCLPNSTASRQRRHVQLALSRIRENGTPADRQLAEDLLLMPTGLVAAPEPQSLLRSIARLRNLSRNGLRIMVCVGTTGKARSLMREYVNEHGAAPDIGLSINQTVHFDDRSTSNEQIDETAPDSLLIFGGHRSLDTEPTFDLLLLIQPTAPLFRPFEFLGTGREPVTVVSSAHVLEHLQSEHTPGAIRMMIGSHDRLTRSERESICFWMPGPRPSVDHRGELQRRLRVDIGRVPAPASWHCPADRLRQVRIELSRAVAEQCISSSITRPCRTVALFDDERACMRFGSEWGKLTRVREGNVGRAIPSVVPRPTAISAREFLESPHLRFDRLHVALTPPYRIRLGPYFERESDPVHVTHWVVDGHRLPADPQADSLFDLHSPNRSNPIEEIHTGSNVPTFVSPLSRRRSSLPTCLRRAASDGRAPGSRLDPNALASSAGKVFRKATRGPDGIRATDLSEFDRNQLLRFLSGQRVTLVPSFEIERYQPGPCSTVRVGTREINYRGIAERILLGALALTLRPLAEFIATDLSFGFHPGRGPSALFRWFDAEAEAGRRFLISTDIRRAFPSIALQRVFDVVRSAIPDCRCRTALLNVIESYRCRRTNGLMTGDATSPLAFELVMSHDVDAVFDRNERVRYARWVDNVFLTAADPVDLISAYSTLENSLRPSSLELHPDRGSVIDLCERRADVLGFPIRFLDGRVDFVVDTRQLDERLTNVIERSRSKPSGPRVWPETLSAFIRQQRPLIESHREEFSAWACSKVTRLVRAKWGPTSDREVERVLIETIAGLPSRMDEASAPQAD